MLGWSYFNTDRFEELSEAYAKAIELSPNNAEFRSAYGENDVEGWIKLIRSRKILGENDAAEEALHRALDIFKSAPQEKEKIVTVGHGMGLL